MYLCKIRNKSTELWYNIKSGWVKEISQGTVFEFGTTDLKNTVRSLGNTKVEVVEYTGGHKHG